MQAQNNLGRSGIGMTSERTRRRLVDQVREMGVTNQKVLDVMFELPRELFIDEALSNRAYDNISLPIGFGQTISQPYIVGLMTQTLFDRPRSKVLEIGTGCGYQTAVLAPMCDEVISIEPVSYTHLTLPTIYSV